MLADSHDIEAISSKRVITLLAFVLCTIGFLVDLFSDYTISPNIYDSMMWIVVAGFGFTAGEKFAKPDNDPVE